tara:strand:- start:981 stop:1616 length:636 start_codon:yes stop_codon:yes gene_type:complete
MDYSKQYKQLHNEKSKQYGNGHRGNSTNKDYESMIEWLKKSSSKNILDYGCGKGRLVERLKKDSYNCWGFDLGVPDSQFFAEIKNYVSNKNKWFDKNIDTIICYDVMEHILEDDIDKILSDFIKYDANNIYFLISTVLAKTILPNGMNAHVTVKDTDWWVEILKNKFPDYDINHYSELRDEKRKFGAEAPVEHQYPEGTTADTLIIKLNRI